MHGTGQSFPGGVGRCAIQGQVLHGWFAQCIHEVDGALAAIVAALVALSVAGDLQQLFPVPAAAGGFVLRVS